MQNVCNLVFHSSVCCICALFKMISKDYSKKNHIETAKLSPEFRTNQPKSDFIRRWVTLGCAHASVQIELEIYVNWEQTFRIKPISDHLDWVNRKVAWWLHIFKLYDGLTDSSESTIYIQCPNKLRSESKNCMMTTCRKDHIQCYILSWKVTENLEHRKKVRVIFSTCQL